MNESEIALNAINAYNALKMGLSDHQQLINGLLWTYICVFVFGGLILNLLILKTVLCHTNCGGEFIAILKYISCIYSLNNLG